MRNQVARRYDQCIHRVTIACYANHRYRHLYRRYPWKNWLFAKVSTDEGIYGVGEGTLNYFGKTVEAAIHELKPLVIGMDPFSG